MLSPWQHWAPGLYLFQKSKIRVKFVTMIETPAYHKSAELSSNLFIYFFNYLLSSKGFINKWKPLIALTTA